MQIAASREKRIHEIFEISVLLKGANALLECALGVALLLSSRFNDVVLALIQNELVEDPGDFLARHADGLAHYFTPQFQFYSALYLLSHGIVKVVLVWGLLRDKVWAYPASLAVLGLFVAYQLTKIAQQYSTGLVLLTLFDVFVIALIWHEYAHMRERARYVV